MHQTDDLQHIKAGKGRDGNTLSGLVVYIFGHLRDEQHAVDNPARAEQSGDDFFEQFCKIP